MAKLACVLLIGSFMCSPASGAKQARKDAAAVGSGKPAAGTATLSDGEWLYRFDETAISRADLQALLDFSDHSTLFASGISTSPILNARKEAKAGGGWESWTAWGPDWIRRSRAEVEAARAKLQPRKDVKVPAELEPARKFVVDEALLQHEIDLALLDVVEKNDAAPLASRVLPGVDADTGAACAGAVKKVSAQPSRDGKLREARFEWSNCVIRRKGSYPVAAWKAFLKRYRIIEVHDTSANE
jgi:hypothetical protein